MRKLFSLHYKQMVRSTLWKRNLGTNIFLGIMFFLMMLNFLSISLFIDRFIEETHHGINPVEFINQYIIYYLFIDLLLRLVFQKNHGMIIKPLLIHPVDKLSSANFILTKSIFSIFNLLAVILLVPFAVKNYSNFENGISFFNWLFSALALILTNCYLTVLLKRGSSISAKYIILSGVLLGTPITLTELEIIDALSVSSTLFKSFSQSVVYPLVLWYLATLVYYSNLQLVKNQLRLDKIQQSVKRFDVIGGKYSILNRFGEIGLYAALELKLLLRHKRSRATLIFSGAMIFIGVVIYPSYTARSNYAPVNTLMEERLERYEENISYEQDASEIEFKIISDELPPEATVFITGNHQGLNNWEADGVALHKKGNEWIRKLRFANGTSLEYKFTLGSWKNQLLSDKGERMENMKLTINSDTTLVIKANHWELGGFGFYKIMLVYMGILVTGMLVLGYGQFIFGWESSFFDLISSKRIDLFKYIHTKFLLMLAAGALVYIVSLAYAVISIEFIKIHTSLFLYNVGINSYVLLILATLNRKRMDLGASIISTQGKGSSQYLAIIPVLFVPTGIIIPFALSNSFDAGLLFMGGLGAIGVLFQKQFLKYILKLFYKQRYKLASGFRIT